MSTTRITTLAEVLKPRGYRTGGFVGAFVLDRRWGIAQGFDHYFDDFDLSQVTTWPPGSMRRSGPAAKSSTTRSHGSRRIASGPFFAWVHLYDPHSPYQPPEPYRSRFPATMQGAYDGEVAATDAQIGRLLDALECQRAARLTRSSSSSATTASRWASTASSSTDSSFTTRRCTSR